MMGGKTEKKKEEKGLQVFGKEKLSPVWMETKQSYFCPRMWHTVFDIFAVPEHR